MSGWIKLHRAMLEWEWYDDLNVSRLFIHCLLKANHKDNKYKGKLIERGSFVTGFDVLSKETSLSVQKIRTAIKKLKSTNDLTIKSTSQGTLIQVVNYDKFQEATSEATNEQQTNNKRATTNKKEKKEKNEKKFIPPAISEVSKFFDDNGYKKEAGEKAFNYYQDANWKDARGNQVKNWKQKMRGVWFKDENKKQESGYNPF